MPLHLLLCTNPFQRKKAWDVCPYPCIGLYSFLDIGITELEDYPSVLNRVKVGQTLLDLGCCFGTDLRKLVFDGAPAQNLRGAELRRDFIDLGYELFLDRSTLKVHFHTGDFFDTDATGLPIKAFDMIHASSFYHLFNWSEQVDCLSKTVALLKPMAGSVILGRQVASDTPGEWEHITARSNGTMYRHNVDTFHRLVEEVSMKTQRLLEAKASLGEEMGFDSAPLRMMRFTITVK